MVIINTDPWEHEEDKKPASVASETSSHQRLFGFQDLASDYYQVLRQRSRPRACKIIWAVIIVVLAVCTFILVYQLVSDFLANHSFNVSEIEWSKKVILPAITICNFNFINYKNLTLDLKRSWGISENLVDEFDMLMNELAKYDGSDDIHDHMDHDAFEDLNSYEKVWGSIAMRFSDSINSTILGKHDYSFANEGLNITNYARMTLPTELGTCLEINDNGRMQQSYNGVHGGFTIDLDAKVDHYLPTLASKGFVVFIREQDETVMLNQGGYVVAPGTETFMKLSAKQVTRLRPPHGTCENVESHYSKYEHHFETVRECLERQKIEIMLQICGCIPWYYYYRMNSLHKDLLTKAIEEVKNAPATEHVKKRRSFDAQEALKRPQRSHRGTAPTVTPPMTVWITTWVGTKWWETVTEQPIYQSDDYKTYACNFVNQQICHLDLEYRIRIGKIKLEGCPEPCFYREWGVEMSSTIFPPSEEYYNRFIKDYVDEWPAPNFTYARDDITRLHIYYDDLKITKIEQVKAYEPQNFIAEFGGTVDLFIGFSFFTIFQLVEIALAALLYKCCRKIGNKDVSPIIAQNDTALNILPVAAKVDAENAVDTKNSDTANDEVQLYAMPPDEKKDEKKKEDPK